MGPSAHLNSRCAGPALQRSPVGFGAGNTCCSACSPRGCSLLLVAVPVCSCAADTVRPGTPGLCWLGKAEKLLSRSTILHRPGLPTPQQTLPGPAPSRHELSLPIGRNVLRQQRCLGKGKGLRLPPRSCGRCRAGIDPAALPRQQMPRFGRHKNLPVVVKE